MTLSRGRARLAVRAFNAGWLLATVGSCTAQLDNPEAFNHRPRPGSEASGAAGSGVLVGGASSAGSDTGGRTSSAGSDTGGRISSAGSDTGGRTSSAESAGVGGSLGGGSSAGNAGVGGSLGGGSVGTAGTGGLPSCVAALFVNGTGKCSGYACHAKSASPAAGLDLASPGVESRLVDQLAGHHGLDASAMCSKTDKLIDSADPSKSWVLKKIMGQQGSCGVRMPYGGTLTTAELTCMQIWIQNL